jgi:hypothetical protein
MNEAKYREILDEVLSALEQVLRLGGEGSPSNRIMTLSTQPR